MMSRGAWLALAIGALLLALAWRGTHSPGPPAGGYANVACTLPAATPDPASPLQSGPDGMGPFRLGRARVTPLAGFSVEARVLSREDYSSGPEAEFSPTDLALGWGPMAAPGLADTLDVSQSGRWYHYGWGADGPPLPPKQIARHSANMHLIPADARVAETLARVRAGDNVRLEGWLVRIERDDGWKWSSSLRRDDTGQGACELVYVCALQAR